jgi:GMP synthase-like glutamine amidotransferase
VRILSVVHSANAKTELFRHARHHIDEWQFGSSGKPPASYDAYMVFGGSMHADQDHLHPWLADEVEWLQGLIERGTPVLGVCLGAQLLARAAGARVGALPDGPEIGWYDVERLADDPVLDVLPRRFEAFEWHHYTYAVPDGAVETARSERATQAFRLGDACWAVQFHPEVTHAQVQSWIADPEDPAPDPDGLREETAAKIARWNELGLALCDAFVAAAERVAA